MRVRVSEGPLGVIERVRQSQAALVRDFAQVAADTASDDFVGLANLIITQVDSNEVLDPSSCDPASWDPYKLQCVPIITDSITNYFIPDYFDRAMNVVKFHEEISDWCMGAVGSAVMFVAE